MTPERAREVLTQEFEAANCTIVLTDLVQSAALAAILQAAAEARNVALEEAANIGDAYENWCKFKGDFEAHQVSAAIRNLIKEQGK